MLSDGPVDGREGALTMFSRQVVEAYLAVADQDRHHVMLLRWLGFRSQTIEYDQQERHSGRGSYGWSTLLDSAISGLLFNSTKLLKLIVFGGIAFSCIGFVMAFVLAVRRLTHFAAPGWTSIIVVQLLVGGAILVSVGVVGMYVGRIFDQARRRPMFIVERQTSEPAAALDR
jgi:dolichol-phosphate mannosyltransferase